MTFLSSKICMVHVNIFILLEIFIYEKLITKWKMQFYLWPKSSEVENTDLVWFFKLRTQAGKIQGKKHKLNKSILLEAVPLTDSWQDGRIIFGLNSRLKD